MKRKLLILLVGTALNGVASSLYGEFLFAPVNPTDNGFFTPTFEQYDGQTADDYGLWFEYSAWDVFYSPNSKEGNYPDIFAPAGGVFKADGKWHPEERPPGFPGSSDTRPLNPFAFWDTYNPTITQVKGNSAFIIGPDSTGNIYSFQEKTGYQLHNKPDYSERVSTYNGTGSLGSVIFQFQTDGTNVDFSNIILKYKGVDGNTYSLGVNSPETEYLREYSTTGSDHWSATAGYRNRTLLQWDLSGVEGTGEFWIEWASLSSSMSFQKADLVTLSYYSLGMPGSSTWGDDYTNGTWSGSEYWQAQSTPQENGNLKFKNADVVNVDIDDSDHTVGEIIFDGANNVTIGSSGDYRLTSNTGITVRSDAVDAADKVYTFDADYGFGALNFFEVNSGTVVMNGDISGNYGIVKMGDGAVVMNGDNTFTQFLAVQGGELRINGSNQYTGSTTVVDGRLIISNAHALGNSTLALAIGGDADLYAFTAGSANWMAELLLDGDLTLNRDISLGAGDFGKRLGAINTADGATFSGNVSFSGAWANPDAQGVSAAVGNTFLTAKEASDRLVFSGSMTGGNSQKTVTLDGLGEVVFAGVNKTYATSTVVSKGTLLIEVGTDFINSGAISVDALARLNVKGGITGSGDITLNGGVLNVDGTIGGSGTFIFNGGKLTGTGHFLRQINLGDGDILSPGDSTGTLHTGSQTWGGGGVYLWEIAAADGSEGEHWDFLDISGTLNVTATVENRFELRIATLGSLDDFDDTESYSWLIARATGGIENFDASLFSINTAGFSNFYVGSFSLYATGDELYLQYAIPEPSTWMLVGVGVVFFGWSQWRRRTDKLRFQA